MNSSLPPQLLALDETIRSGRSKEARRTLELWLKTDSHRELSRLARVQLASFCRRTGLFLWAIRLLNPWVRPSVRSEVNLPLPDEIAEYAASLSFLGAGQEALELLEKINADSHPQALLFKAFTHFSTWNYSASLPALKKYVKHPKIDPYARQVGRVNLAAALVACEKWEESYSLLEQLRKSCREENQTLLLANTLLISAQKAIDQEDLEQAKTHLLEAKNLQKAATGIDTLFLEKWDAILALKETGSTLAWHKVRDRALFQKHFETVRDLDFYFAKIKRDGKLLEKIYYGTPFPEYRARIENRNLAQSYHWILQKGPHPFHLCISDGKSNRKSSMLKFGQVRQRLLQALAKDFYRPQRMAELHAALFPDRHYHPVHSPLVVRQAILRLRAWFKKNQVPLQIRENASSYSLYSKLPFVLELPVPTQEDLEQKKLQHWVTSLGEIKSISRGEAAKTWRVSGRTAFTRLKMLEAEKLLYAQGKGHQHRYYFDERLSSVLPTPPLF